MSKQNKYGIKVNNHGNIEEYEITGDTIEKALENFLDECIEEDNTGIFFELEDANVPELSKNPKFYVVREYGIVLE